MNVLWIGAYPHYKFLQGHPVPWMTMLANQLASLPDISLTVVSYHSDISQDETIRLNGVTFVYLKVPDDKVDLLMGYSQRIKRMRAYLAEVEDGFDVLHIHGSEQQYQVMGAYTKLPTVLSVQGIVTEYLNYLPRKIDYRHASWRVAAYYEKKFLPHINHFICRTHWDTEHTLRLCPGAVVHQNWEPIRHEFYEPLNPRPNQATALLFVGGLNPIKGIRELLQVFDRLSQQGNFRLIITGAGNKIQLSALIRSYSLTNINLDRVEHRGQLNSSDLRATYEEAFCLVHPSYIDNSPNSICEAQLAGLPVVASDVGGVSSLITSGSTGLLTSLDVKSIADAVLTLWNNPALARSIADMARLVALQRHDAKQILQNTLKIYDAVMAAHSYA
ncbi:glycosyltransferase family 4 protein [Spirosoma taeanense]|uniref:Glycosyltransferase family 4 protein n=1 Tax=Spirosoma taeanense TaxID=2735870 RepID=A0A6M5Y495_9BACT|nr:glycosyltransferase family 4 protein [Spirosoma taeanense]QJW88011.1 glycosyltransferase family 4 protein [Spirosoma taeanense]